MALLAILRKLAQGGRAIITTIHQPSSRLYRQLDKLMLLSKVCWQYVWLQVALDLVAMYTAVHWAAAIVMQRSLLASFVLALLKEWYCFTAALSLFTHHYVQCAEPCNHMC